MPKYPDTEIDLSKCENAKQMLADAIEVMRTTGCDRLELGDFAKEAANKTPEATLEVIKQWMTVSAIPTFLSS